MANKVRQMAETLTRNWLLKLLALVLAAITFYAIRGATSFEVHYEVPVEVELEAGFAILEQSPRTVDVAFRGSQEELRRLEQKQIRVVVRPEPLDSHGAETIQLDARKVEGNLGVRVVQIRPGVVTVKYDRQAEKRFPVARPKLRGRPLFGRAEVDYDPRFVTVRGPMQRLQIREVFTEPVDVDGRVESFTRQVRVLSGDPWVMNIDPAEITVRVSIVTDSRSREIPDIPVHAVIRESSSVDVTFVPPTVTVTLHGREEVLDEVADEAVKVFVDCVGLEAGAAYDLPVSVHLPPGRDLNATVEPEAVTVTVFNREPAALEAAPAAAGL